MKENMLKFVKNYYYLNDIEKEKIIYGLSIIASSVKKLFIVIVCSLLLNFLKETIYLIIFNFFIRLYSYGIHMNNSFKCDLLTLFCFVVFPYLTINLKINLYVKVSLSILIFFSFLFFSPSDTEKRPIVNNKKRKILKFFSTILCLIYIVLTFTLNCEVSNIILISLIIQALSINPIIYKIFKQKYNNYKNYYKYKKEV